MDLVISEQTLNLVKLTAVELKTEMAVWLFQQDRLTLGKAAILAGIDRISFQRLLASRKIPMHYGLADLEQDVKMIPYLRQD